MCRREVVLYEGKRCVCPPPPWEGSLRWVAAPWAAGGGRAGSSGGRIGLLVRCRPQHLPAAALWDTHPRGRLVPTPAVF